MLVQIDYELAFDAPFHFGTGVTAGLIDRTVIKDAGGYLYVPASTFKGVVREHCEHLSHFYLPDTTVASPHDARATLNQFWQTASLISRIFGSPLSPGGLHFDDARQERRKDKELQTGTATQARIDRLTRTAVNEALYTSEFGNSYLLFRGAIKGQLNCTPIPSLSVGETDLPQPTYSLLLLLAGMLMVERLGGNKSTGKGQCRCDIKVVRLDRKRCNDALWRSWIQQLEVLGTYAASPEGGKA